MRLQNGSALLLVLAVLSMATMLILNIWFVAGLQLDIIAERERWYKKIYAAEAVLNTGLMLARKQFGALMTIDVTTVLQQADLKAIFDQASVTIKRPDDTTDSGVVMVTALCFTKDRVPFQIRCLLKKNSVTTDKGNEVQFVVHAFTVGGGV